MFNFQYYEPLRLDLGNGGSFPDTWVLGIVVPGRRRGRDRLIEAPQAGAWESHCEDLAPEDDRAK